MQLGLIGFPLEHSRSPEIFARFFDEDRAKGASYKLYPLEDITTLRSWLKSLPNLVGFNVTIPHKKSIIPMLDWVADEAIAIGAVNTVKVVQQEGKTKLHGYNTDYYGFATTLKQFLGDYKPQRALVLGTGGSANTVVYTLAKMGIAYTKVSRNSSADAPMTYDDISDQTIAQTQLIINTTPLGMYPSIKSFPKIPYQALTPQHYLYDLVYNPLETMFLQKGAAFGANTQTGITMLELQARKAWEIWKEGV